MSSAPMNNDLVAATVNQERQHRHTLTRLVIGDIEPGTIDPVQWPTLEALAVRHGLAPMLARTLNKSVEMYHDSLSRATLRSARHFTLQDIAQKEINRILSQAGIPAIWLKGAALARTLYADPVLRPMGDLDVLVPYDQARTAAERLLANGYQWAALDSFCGTQQVVDPADKSNHHYELIGGPSRGVAVEIHFRLLAQNDELLSLDKLEWFRQHTTEQRFEDDTVYTVLATEANLLYLAAHAVLQHGESETLLHYLDLHLLIAQQNPNWSLVIAKAEELGWIEAIVCALSRTQEYYGTPIPHDVYADLNRCRPLHKAEKLVCREDGAGLRWERARGTLAGMSIRGKMRYGWGSVFPSMAYMRRKYDVRGERPLWRLYLHRWRVLTEDVGSALWTRLSQRRSRAEGQAMRAHTRPVEPVVEDHNSADLIEQLLAQNAPVHFRAGGQSMRPAIRDGDQVRVRPVVARDFRTGAILLYRYGERLILHRLVKVEAGLCLMVADASGRDVQHIAQDAIIGVAEWVQRGNDRIRLDTPVARMKGWGWFLLRPVRRCGRYFAVKREN